MSQTPLTDARHFRRRGRLLLIAPFGFFIAALYGAFLAVGSQWNEFKKEWKGE